MQLIQLSATESAIESAIDAVMSNYLLQLSAIDTIDSLIQIKLTWFSIDTSYNLCFKFDALLFMKVEVEAVICNLVKFLQLIQLFAIGATGDRDNLHLI